ncbi:MAG: class I SAM-dependent methyltransferase [Bacteroidota bacterium]
MNDQPLMNLPALLPSIEVKSDEIGFTMPSDRLAGSLLRSLIASRPRGRFLELGTGVGLSLCWMVDGMDAESYLITIDNDPDLSTIAEEYFRKDKRVEIICEDGSQWIRNHLTDKFDLIFADAWPGKYSELDEVLSMVKSGGFYVIDDMAPQPNWPEGHDEKVKQLIAYLEGRKDLTITKMNWSTGVIIATKLSD